MMPYATLEPIRDLLLQMFMGEKFGRDPIWEGHLASEIHAAEVEVDAVLYETYLPLGRILSLGVGQTLVFDVDPTDPVLIKCGNVPLTEGTLGKVDDSISIRVAQNLRKPKMTLAAFERAMQSEMEN